MALEQAYLASGHSTMHLIPVLGGLGAAINTQHEASTALLLRNSSQATGLGILEESSSTAPQPGLSRYIIEMPDIN